MSKDAEVAGVDKGNYADRPDEDMKKYSVGKDQLNIPGIVQWQFDHHKGFCYSFVNTIRYGPIMNQESDWVKLCDIIKDKDLSSQSFHLDSNLRNSKILVVFGDTDGVVVAEDVSKDLVHMFGGPDHITFEIVPGGHGFPVPSCDEVVECISRFWCM